MSYDRDLARMRRGVLFVLLLNLAAFVALLFQRLWIQALAGAVWTITCLGWLASIRYQQLARDFARIHEAGLDKMRREIGRQIGGLDE